MGVLARLPAVVLYLTSLLQASHADVEKIWLSSDNLDDWQTLQLDSDTTASKQWQKIAVLGAFQACTLESGQNNWLVSPPIIVPSTSGGSFILRVRVSFLMHACDYSRYTVDQCKHFIKFYVASLPTGRNAISSTDLGSFNFVKDIRLASPSFPDSTDIIVNATAFLANSSSTSSRDFRIALRDEGSCTQGVSISVSNFFCGAIEGALVSFPRSFPSGSPVQGSCKTGSQPDAPPLQRDCLPGGSWTPPSTRCVCKPGYVRTRSGCIAVNPCDSSPCYNSGTCVEENGDFRCQCIMGFSGKTCEEAVGPCTSSPCLHGTCSPQGLDAYVCFCLDGWTGTRCDLEDHCYGQRCSGHGYCKNGQLGYTCNCGLGFTGRDCEVRVCDNVTCFNGGTCLPDDSTSTGYKCACSDHFEGDHCQQRVAECQYRIWIQTSSDRGAGTDERVFVTLGVQKYGELRQKTVEVAGSFERKHQDYYSQVLPLCGSLRQVSVRLAYNKRNIFGYNNWKLSQVKVDVDDGVYTKTYKCGFNVWFKPGNTKTRPCGL